MNELKEFLNALAANPKARDLLKEMKEPASMEEAAAMYADIAEKAGISVSKDTIREFLASKEKAQQEATARAAEAVKESLTDADLDTVAGGEGPNSGCASTFVPHEWCWFSDSCAYIINDYSSKYNLPHSPADADYVNDFYNTSETNGWTVLDEKPDDDEDNTPFEMPEPPKIYTD